MNQLYERIVLFSKSNQISLYAIEKGTGMARGSLRKWATSMPSGDRILRVANFLILASQNLIFLPNNTDPDEP